MHLLATTAGQSDSIEDAIDLEQTSGDIVFLSSADSELNLVNRAYEFLRSSDAGLPTLRLANLLQLRNNYSLDLYVEKVLSSAQLVIVRLLGGVSYWSYGVEEISRLHEIHGVRCVFLAGDEHVDETLSGYNGGIASDDAWRLWQYLVHGGSDNAVHFLQNCMGLLEDYKVDIEIPPPCELAKAGLYHIHKASPSVSDFVEKRQRKRAAILFYRAYMQASDLDPINAMIESLEEQDIQAIPIYCSGLKDPHSAEQVRTIFRELVPDVIISSLGFHLGASQLHDEVADISPYWLGVDLKAPVLQVIFSSQSEQLWESRNNALNIRDIAMYIALTELDGNIFTRSVSFKDSLPMSEYTQIAPAVNKAQASRIDFCSRLVRAYCDLQETPNIDKRVAIIMANYPGKDGRLANGVGLDTPESAMQCMQALGDDGYDVSGFEAIISSHDLMEKLSGLPTNAIAAANSESKLSDRNVEESLTLSDYMGYFETLPLQTQQQIIERWGEPDKDPFFMGERQSFALPLFVCGHVAIVIQPARGYHIDPIASYHDPALVPPHNYCAVYFWLRHEFCSHAVVHLGKHGNLEWLPGKALALSESCYPEVILGAMPHIYPFIVNDPGEGSQAKRRTSAVIIDHLTPPMVRAENYGILSDLESLCDEYYESLLMDPRRARYLRGEIVSFAGLHKLDLDCGLGDIDADDDDSIISALDGFLCELKESQIRSGLHVLMCPPAVETMGEFAVSLLRYPRFDGVGCNQSIIRAIALDLGLELSFDPLDCDYSLAYEGVKPDVLVGVSDDLWRSCGDTVERLHVLAERIISGIESSIGENSALVLSYWRDDLSLRLSDSAVRERGSFLASLRGEYIASGSSGAPSRARPDVLPTGRNFYSVDVRSVPTLAAWHLGWSSAQQVAERHAQEHGDYPSQVVVNVWGTSNMRTGGDDIAQALALLGVRPTWDSAAKRVTGFEVLPLSILGRPRIDVSLRISGFFRDAFPSLIELFDKAVRCVQGLSDESIEDNPVAEHYRSACESLVSEGYDERVAGLVAGRRIFGSPSGAYGAGLQALMDEGVWESRSDIAESYLRWGSYAYGVGDDGALDRDGFERVLKRASVVLHNQDNREHDILDSDDYYQFEGGVSSAIEHLSGSVPVIYHNDHSDPVSPKVRTLDEELVRVVRSRAVNPKWLSSVMEHGYKGAFEIAATVDYLFAYSATTDVVMGHHFDLLFDAYVVDGDVRDFIRASNPSAWSEICSRFEEAISRGLWRPGRNDWHELMQEKTCEKKKKPCVSTKHEVL